MPTETFIVVIVTATRLRTGMMPDSRRSTQTTTSNTGARRRGSRRAGAATLHAVSSCLAALTVFATPAVAEPSDAGVGPADSADATFIQDLNQIGIPYPSESEALHAARNACMQIADGSSIREAVDGVRATNPAMSLLQGAHFVWITRNVYCPGHRSPL